MADQIKGTDIIEDGHLNDAIQQAEKYLAVLKETDNVVKKLGVDFKKTAQAADGGTAESIDKLNKELIQSNEVKKQSILIDQQIVKAEAKLAALDKERAASLAKARLETQRTNKAAKEQAILTSKTSTEYEKASVRLRQMRRQLKDLALTETKASKSTLQLQKKVQALDAQLKKADARAGQFQRSVGNYGKAVERAGSIMRGFGATLLASFSIQAVSSFVKGSIEAFRVQEKAVAKVTQAVKSTGGAAGKTSEELQKMASALQKNTLFGDEEILNKVTAQLLTFTNIAGPQFDRTQQAALDLATVLDGDLQSASIQLGKALNDPAKNLSALSRSGIQFSKEQIATIKSLQETNQLAEAQNIILAELERQYGGQAKAAAEVDGGITQLSNAFGDFKEQVGKQLLEALKPTIKSLKEFFENLSEEDVRKFVDTIFKLIKVIKVGAGAWLAYTGAVKAANAINKAFGNTIIKNVKGFGLYAAAAAALVLILQDIWKQYQKIETAGDTMNRINEETNEILAEETGKLKLLGKELLANRDNMEKRQEIIDEINANYGTTLQNLEDEKMMVEQLTAAYQDIVKSLRQKIKLELVEEDIKEKSRRLIELQKETQNLGEIEAAFKLATDPAFALRLKEQEELQSSINALEAEYLELKKDEAGIVGGTGTGDDDGGGGGTGTGTTKQEDELAKFRRRQLEARQQLEADLIAAGVPREMIEEKLFRQRRKQYFDELQFIKGLGSEYEGELKKVTLEAEKFREKGFFIDPLDATEIKKIEKTGEQAGDALTTGLTNSLIEANKKIAEDRKKRLEELKKFRDESLAIIKQITDGIQKNIDQRIQARQEEISESQSAISRLQSLQEAGNADAAQAIKAEQIRIAKEKLEIEKLQKKKRNLLITVTALEKASQNIGSGDPNPLKNATSQIKNFLGGLPTFAKGTKGTVGDDLGRTGTKDGHIVRVDDKEHILSIKDSQKLHAAGLNTNADIVGAAMAHQNNSIAKNAMMMNAGLSFTDANIVNKLDAVEKAVKNIKIVQQHIDLKSGKEVIIDGNKTIKNDYNPSAFKI
jgi:hypothetical protein